MTQTNTKSQNTAQPEKALFSDGSFTPGPWIEFADQGKTVAIMPAGRPGEICEFAAPYPKRADARLMRAAPDLHSVARAYEAWEADVIMTADWSGETPRLTQEQWDRLIEIQTMRNAAIAKAEGRTNLADAHSKNPLEAEGHP